MKPELPRQMLQILLPGQGRCPKDGGVRFHPLSFIPPPLRSSPFKRDSMIIIRVNL